MIAVFALSAGGRAAAAPLDSELSKGYAHLRAGDTDEALNIFRQLLTESPDSELVRYSIAAAQYKRAEQLFDSGDTDQANEAMSQAQDIFGELARSETKGLNENAALNWANGFTEKADHFDSKDQYQERVQALQQAVTAYESVLSEHPNNERAKANLDHARYELKRMLQEPPPDQQKSEDNQSGDQGDQGESQDDQSGEQEKQDQDQDEEQQPSDEQQDQQDENQDQDSQGNQNQQQNQSGKSNQQKELDRQNVEAILQSLEDRDREEQKNLRKATGLPQVRNGKWW
jgi:Ca-activated chloride channel family protein